MDIIANCIRFGWLCGLGFIIIYLCIDIYIQRRNKKDITLLKFYDHKNNITFYSRDYRIVKRKDRYFAITRLKNYECFRVLSIVQAERLKGI